MQFTRLCPDSSAALCNACQLKINRHLVANLKASQALELHSVHANLEPQTGCYHCTSYAQQAFSWSNHPGVREQKHRDCYLNRNLEFMLFLHCFTFKHVHAKLSPHHLKEIGKPGCPFLEHCFNVIGLS